MEDQTSINELVVINSISSVDHSHLLNRLFSSTHFIGKTPAKSFDSKCVPITMLPNLKKLTSKM